MHHITSHYENLNARHAKIPYVGNDLSNINDGYIVFMLTLSAWYVTQVAIKELVVSLLSYVAVGV